MRESKGRTRSSTKSSRERAGTIGAVLWIAQPLCIVVELAAVSQVRTPYSMLDNTISEAGAVTCTTIVYAAGQVPVCSPLGWLLNAATVASGLAVMVGSVLLHPWLPTRGIRAGATIAALLSGLSLIGTGLVPVDLDLTLHVVVALPQFLTFPLMLILLAAALRHQAPLAALAGLVGAAVCSVGTVAYFAQLDEPRGGGVLERLALWPWFLALAPTGFAMLQRIRRPTSAPTAGAGC